MNFAQPMKALRWIESLEADGESWLAIKAAETSGRAFEMNTDLWKRIGSLLQRGGDVLPWGGAQCSDTFWWNGDLDSENSSVGEQFRTGILCEGGEWKIDQRSKQGQSTVEVIRFPPVIHCATSYANRDGVEGFAKLSAQALCAPRPMRWPPGVRALRKGYSSHVRKPTASRNRRRRD